MAAAKTYVEIKSAAVVKSFDKTKHKAKLPKIMRTLAEKAINASSKLSTKTGDKKNGLSLDMSIVSIEKKPKGKGEEVSLNLKLTGSKKNSMFAFGGGSSSVPVDDPKKIEADVEWVLREAMKHHMKKMIKELEKPRK